MLISLKDLKGYSIQAKDGQVGKANDFYFDEQTWTVRYLVDKTGIWLFGRQILLSPVAIAKVDPATKTLSFNLKQAEITNSPQVGQETLLSKDMEKSLIDYYRWPTYLGGPDSLTEAGYTQTQGPYPLRIRDIRKIVQAGDQEKPALRSSELVLGYAVASNDAVFGQIADFFVDTDSWEIRYILINTGRAATDKKVLIDPEWIDWISWKQARVSVSMDREKIQGCPSFDLAMPINREYEELLYNHYECKKYWDEKTG